MRPGTVVGALVALLLAATACGGGDEAADPGTTGSTRSEPTTTDEREPAREGKGWASEDELAWLTEFGKWSQGFNLTLDDVRRFTRDRETRRKLVAGDEAVLAEYEETLEPLRECTEYFERAVGPPPTRRLETGAELANAACVHYERAAAAALEAVEQEEPEDAHEVEVEVERAASVLTQLNETLPPGETLPLPIVDGPSSRSHRNPRYGQVAGSLVEMLVEVRCWSKRDWRRLLKEERALTGLPLPAKTTFGVTGITSRRVNLAPLVCAQLDRLTYARERPRDPEEMLLVAHGVNVLAHEAQHRAGVVDEVTAECHAMQQAEEAAAGLGADREYATALARLLWETYPTLPAEYRSDECRDGGKLDLDEVSDRWP